VSQLFGLVQEKVKSQSEENISLAIEKYSEADECLNTILENGGFDKELLNRAINLYEDSLQLNSKQVQPYLGLAYIAYSAGDFNSSLGLLNKALELEPQNEKVNELHGIVSAAYREKNISGIISKAAGKSLSEKINSKGLKFNFNIFEKLSKLVIQPSKKSGNLVQSSVSSVPASESSVKGPAKPTGNFFENIKSISSK
jgi:tetratricopeptide (TPR) repeat protein